MGARLGSGSPQGTPEGSIRTVTLRSGPNTGHGGKRGFTDPALPHTAQRLASLSLRLRAATQWQLSNSASIPLSGRPVKPTLFGGKHF